jgi:sugar phosphate isomerase/epimerase
MMKNILAGHTNSYHTYGLDESLAGIARAGYKYVELSAVRGWTEHIPLEASETQLNEIKSKLDGAGLKVASLSGHSDLTTAAGVVDGKKAVDLTQKFGVTIMNTAIGGHYSEDEDKGAFMDHIHDLADYAAGRGITLALEVHGDIMGSGQLSVPLIKEINRDNVRINYDTANCIFYGNAEPIDDLRVAIPYMAHIHLKDKIGGQGEWNFPAPGEGRLEFSTILKILEEEGYDGPTSVEVEFSGEPWPPLEEVNRAMKSAYDHLKGLGLA